jgi:DNA-binding response OmpR family regulator
MSRKRGAAVGGYVRKTLSLPAELVARLEAYLEQTQGATISAVMSVAGGEFLDRQAKRKGKS